VSISPPDAIQNLSDRNPVEAKAQQDPQFY